MQAATIASTSPARATSAVNAAALLPSDLMMLTVSSAAAPLRSTQNTCAPSRANVTAVALPLPQPGPIEPAPTTIAILPLSRCIDCPLRSCRYRSLIVVTLAPTGWPGISGSVRQSPSAHNGHSPAPELSITASGIAARTGLHVTQPIDQPGGGSMPAPAPLTWVGPVQVPVASRVRRPASRPSYSP